MIVVLVAGFASFAPRAAGVVGPGPNPNAFSTLRIGALQEPDSLNPFRGVLSASYSIWAHTYELLVGIGPDLTPVPAIASSWSVDAANLNWTFRIQQGVKFHDGVGLTAEDVNFTFRYIWPKTAWNPIGCDLALLQSYLGDPKTNVGVDVNNITVLDPYTIWIPTYQPKANILSMFIQILPKHIWSGIGCNRATNVANNPPIGTGMYKLTTWVRGQYIQLDLFPDYWRLDPAQDYVDQIIISYYGNSAALDNAFRAGSIDATSELPADKFQLMPGTVGGAASPNVGKLTVDSIEMSEVGMCLASDKLIADYGAKGGRNWLLTNVTVRRALQLSADRANLVQNVINGLGKPGSTLIAPATPFWHYNVTAAENYTFDLDRARKLLNDPKGDGAPLKVGATVPGDYGENIDPARPENKDAFIDTNGDHIRDVVDPAQVVAGDQWGPSAPNSNSLSFTISVRSYSAENLNSASRLETSWSRVGIKVVTDTVSENQLISITYACSEDLYIWGWGGDVDPDFMLSVMTTGQIMNWQDAWYSNDTYDKDYVLQQRQVDPYQRQATIFEMQRILYKDAAYLVLYYPYSLTLVRTDKFTGWGDWNTHPGLGLTGFGNDLVMLTLRAATGAPTNQCPTTPVLEGTFPRHVYVNVSSGFTANASDLENDPMSWIFTWGDTTTTPVTTTSGVTQASVRHAWNATGSYDVLVTVTDNQCGSNVVSLARQVIVDPLPAQYGWVNGTVRDATNLAHPPVEGATVTATLAGTSTSFSDTTGAAGQYMLLLANGTYNLTASQALYAAETRTGVVVADNAQTIDFSLFLVRGWIAGTVTAAVGGAISGAGIRITGPRSATAQTDSQGRYNVTLAPGTYNVSVSAGGYYNKATSNLSVVDGQTTKADFALDPVPVPAEGLSTLMVAAIVGVVLAAIIGLAAWMVLRRRKKEEEIVGPPLPPPPPPKNP
ncbi:MAG: ABC transporter substrate-binding protein [Thermoplasmata archaeon]